MTKCINKDKQEQPIMTLANISFAYNPEKVILDTISFQLTTNEIIAILGPSGCGKTTLLRVIGGLLTPLRGRIYFQENIGDKNYAQTGFVFQKPVLLPWSTLENNMNLPAELLGCQIPHERINELLTLVGLWNDRDKYPDELSGGMQARAAVVRALAYHPQVLLLDEPFGALDQVTRDYLNIEVWRIFQRMNTAAIIVTHSISEAVFLADRVLIMGNNAKIEHQIVTSDLSPTEGERLYSSQEFVSRVSEIRSLMGRNYD